MVMSLWPRFWPTLYVQIRHVLQNPHTPHRSATRLTTTLQGGGGGAVRLSVITPPTAYREERSIVMTVSVCLSLCVFVCLRAYLRKYTSDLYQIKKDLLLSLVVSCTFCSSVVARRTKCTGQPLLSCNFVKYSPILKMFSPTDSSISLFNLVINNPGMP